MDLLEQSSVKEAEVLSLLANNHMVDDLNTQDLPGIFDALGGGDIWLARRWISRWMLVRHDKAMGIDPNRLFEDPSDPQSSYLMCPW